MFIGLFYLSELELQNDFSDVVPYLKKLNLIAAEGNLKLSELSLLWLANMKEIKKIVIGLENEKQLSFHLKTLNKKVDPLLFDKASQINYRNNNILNPGLWEKN